MRSLSSFFREHHQENKKKVLKTHVSADHSKTEMKTPNQVFYSNLGQNISLSVAYVPAEGLALRRIFYMLDHSQLPSPSYVDTIKKIGLSGLFSGVITRTSYCLLANFVTLHGIHYFGSNYDGLFKTSLVQNATLPIFIASNARQMGLNVQETVKFVGKGFGDPVVHASFLLRNSMMNSCVFLGLSVRDRFYQANGEKQKGLSSVLGLCTSVTSATLMLSFLKPFYTGSYPFPARVRVATTLPAKFPLLIREFTSMSLIFGNTSPKGKQGPLKPERENESMSNCTM